MMDSYFEKFENREISNWIC